MIDIAYPHNGVRLSCCIVILSCLELVDGGEGRGFTSDLKFLFMQLQQAVFSQFGI